ncbi:MAG: hypothetical protein AAF496_14525 [Pseudomonadota bacterium]
MSNIGHNKGPTLEPGHLWRTHMWRSAQRKLMPNAVPLLVVRLRVKRAAELGLDYKTYASIRQFSGQDIVGLLFSSNALRILGRSAEMPDAETRALRAVKSAKRLSLVHAPTPASDVLRANPVLDATAAAPRFTDNWSQMRQRLQRFVRDQHLPGNQILIIGDTALESEWTTAARAAGYLPADQYFRRASSA